MPGLFYRLPRNVLAIFSGRNLAWHALAIVLTIIILESGFDWTWHLWTRDETFLWLARPAIILGPNHRLSRWRQKKGAVGGWVASFFRCLP